MIHTKGAPVVVLCSGGMDSVVALHDAVSKGAEVRSVLTFQYGSKHNEAELRCAALHAKELGLVHRVIHLDFNAWGFKSDLLQSGGAIPDGHYADQVMRQTVVPFRNGIMLAIAAGIAESMDAEKVVIAAHKGDHAIYPDCRQAFLWAMSQAMSVGTYKHVKLFAPFSNMTKGEIVTRGTELGVDFANTWSCYKGGQLHCGVCGTCIERREAFHLAGGIDPTKYAPEAPSVEQLVACDFKWTPADKQQHAVD